MQFQGLIVPDCFILSKYYIFLIIRLLLWFCFRCFLVSAHCLLKWFCSSVRTSNLRATDCIFMKLSVGNFCGRLFSQLHCTSDSFTRHSSLLGAYRVTLTLKKKKMSNSCIWEWNTRVRPAFSYINVSALELFIQKGYYVFSYVSWFVYWTPDIYLKILILPLEKPKPTPYCILDWRR